MTYIQIYYINDTLILVILMISYVCKSLLLGSTKSVSCYDIPHKMLQMNFM